jgi:hypothetical protein
MITIVSGLPRSGTSLMMQILASCGYIILTDGIRTADDNNLNGYYEYAKVKGLKTDSTWFAEAEGKAVKIIAQLLPYIPDGYNYQIYFMERNINEVINSQNKMLDRLEKSKSLIDNDSLKAVFVKQVDSVKRLLEGKINVKMINVSYNNLVKCDSAELESLIVFSGYRLEKKKILDTVNPKLYRERIR